MKQPLSIPALMRSVPTEADAYLVLERLRWGGEPTTCPQCGESGRCYYLKPFNGVSRSTRTGTASQRRVWKCGHCRKQFSVLTGTIFQGTKISVRTWLLVILEMCASKNGVSAREIERKYDLTAKTAWFMLHRIREAMKLEPLAGLLSGTVVADETRIGGKLTNWSNAKRRAARPRWEYGRTDKPVVLALVDTDTGEVRSRVIPNVRGNTLRAAIAEHVEMGATTLVTDEARGYMQFQGEMKGHETVVHSAHRYVRDGWTTNAAENYFSQLKPSIDGTNHHVSKEHLPRYLAEYDFRYSTRKITDTERMVMLAGRFGGRRLTYKPLKRKRA